MIDNIKTQRYAGRIKERLRWGRKRLQEQAGPTILETMFTVLKQYLER